MMLLSISSIWNSVWPILVAILLFLLLIVIHEFGHFIAAKAMGVRVNEFSIGFGPTLFKKQGKETLYAVRLVPFGGFCAMEGEDDESADSKAFCNKKPWRRLIIIIAGAAFNLLFGLILVMIILAPQPKFASTTIAGFSDESISSQYGLSVGDEILKVDGRKIYTTYDLSYAFTGINDGMVDMLVRRNGQKVELKDVKFATETVEDVSVVSVDFSVKGIPKTPLSFISQSIKSTVSYGRIVWLSIIDLIGGKFGISSVSGPVGVTVAIGDVARSGLINLLPMIVLITVNLGVFNLLPIPALDGSRALFILIEMVRRKPIPQKYESAIHAVGLVVLLSFMALVTLKDVFKLFS